IGRNRRVHRVETEEEVGHDRSLLHRRVEGVGAQRLAPKGAVHVGHPEEDKVRFVHARRFWTSVKAAVMRSTISASSASEALYAGATRTWSPVKPSAPECGARTSTPGWGRTSWPG